MPRGGKRPGAGRPKGSKNKQPRVRRVLDGRAARSHQQLLDALAAISRQVGQTRQTPQLGEITVLLRDNVLRRLVGIERALGLVERPQTPKISRRRPLE
jgi:hypothetical protein